MRRFKFRLEAVLKYRAVLEHKCQRIYAAIQVEMKECAARLAAYRADRERIGLLRSEHFDPEEMTRRERYLDVLNERMEYQKQVLEGINARLDAARKDFLEARRAREALEHIRESDMNEYKQLVARQEQKTLDEVATIRYTRRTDMRG